MEYLKKRFLALDLKLLRQKIAVIAISITIYLVIFYYEYRMVGSGIGAAAYIITVILFGWFWGLIPGILCGVFGSILSSSIWLIVHGSDGLVRIFLEAFIIYVFIGAIIGKLSNTNRKLKTALDQVKTLKGLLPICANCKKIRDDKGCWNHVEVYITNHSYAEFSHGLCPDCLKELSSEPDKEIEKITEPLDKAPG